MHKKLSVRIYGEVHGVGFRNFVLRRAEELGLTGWVRNREDDTVEIEAIGAIAPLEDFFSKICHGPENVLIADVQDTWEDFTGRANGEFKILETK